MTTDERLGLDTLNHLKRLVIITERNEHQLFNRIMELVETNMQYLPDAHLLKTDDEKIKALI